MTIFEIEHGGKSYEVDAPDMGAAASAIGAVPPSAPLGGSWLDGIKDYAIGALKTGMQQGPAQFGTMSPGEAAELAPSGVQKSDIGIPKAQNPYKEAVGGAVANPATWLGPGSAALKLGAGVGGALGSEAAGQATEGTPYETPARLGGGLVAGLIGARSLGPKTPVAKAPTMADLKGTSDAGYDAIRNSDALFSPEKLAGWAAQHEQVLMGGADPVTGRRYAFTAGAQGTAPQTLAAVERLKSPPESTASSFGRSAVADALGQPADAPRASYITPANLDALRTHLGDIAGKTELNAGGRPVSTPDAVAAMYLKRQVDDLLSNPPEGFTVAGDIGALRSNAQQARGDYAALSKLRDIDFRSNKAEIQNDRNLTGSLGQKLQQKIGSMLENPRSMRGYSDAAEAQIQSINKPTTGQSVLRTVGRVANYDPHQIAAAILTGGSNIPLQVAGSVVGHMARGLSDSSTLQKVDKLVELLAKESPEYAKRLRNLPPADTMSGKAAVVRALLNIQ